MTGREEISEAEALDDIWEGHDEEMDKGEFFGLPPRPSLSAASLSVELSKVHRLTIYEAAKVAKVGQSCKCAGCLKDFTKKSYQQAFCSNKGRGNCKDSFWNRAKPERTERAKSFASRF